jgi:DhnA family fructose-bisphosphate aldolase class Ia
VHYPEEKATIRKVGEICAVRILNAGGDEGHSETVLIMYSASYRDKYSVLDFYWNGY